MKNNKIIYFFALCTALSACSKSDDANQASAVNMEISSKKFTFDNLAHDTLVNVSSDREWRVYSTETWLSCTPTSSIEAQQDITVSVNQHTGRKARTASLIFLSGTHRDTIQVIQNAVKPIVDNTITVPQGYELVWNDEFNEGTSPNKDLWSYENGAGGWGNNELQHYVAGSVHGENLAQVQDGVFTITAKEIQNTVYSIRINTREAWKYGYFEARLKLPQGKGTWPAFWMLPQHTTAWPAGGEIDIMEEVGYRPNYVSSAIHTTAYNGMNNNQKTNEKFVPTAESDFHVYALEWTEESIRTYCDGDLVFTYMKEDKGSDAWPFYEPFYIKLNLAWGGNWGGAQGVDAAALPVYYEIDYVRVFQKIIE